MWLMTPFAGDIFWTPVVYANPEDAPAPRYHHTALYDALRNRMIIFGGADYLRWSGTRTTSFKMCGKQEIWTFDLDLLIWEQDREQTRDCNLATTHFIPFVLFMVALFLPFI